MKTCSKELLTILPAHVRTYLKNPDKLCEIRLRINQPAKFIYLDQKVESGTPISSEDLRFLINTASHYSPWSVSSMKHGYITTKEGHRIGFAGEFTEGTLTCVVSVCIRIAKDFPHIADALCVKDSLLIIGPPGSGKTTLLRDCIRKISNSISGSVSVIDERCEIFPFSSGYPVFNPGMNTDILSNCSKKAGITMALRSMGPEWIAMDEITHQEDCTGLIQGLWCGAKIIATAHAGSFQDFLSRPVYQPLVKCSVFSSIVIMNRDKHYSVERICL